MFIHRLCSLTLLPHVHPDMWTAAAAPKDGLWLRGCPGGPAPCLGGGKGPRGEGAGGGARHEPVTAPPPPSASGDEETGGARGVAPVGLGPGGAMGGSEPLARGLPERRTPVLILGPSVSPVPSSLVPAQRFHPAWTACTLSPCLKSGLLRLPWRTHGRVVD